ncbi:MAG: cryptochrome/photolyase family protein [Pseudomonadota bacterium]
MGVLRLVLGDQLSPSVSSLADADPSNDLILMAEVAAEATYVRHHKKKIAFVFAAMRAFARDLEEAGFRVRYTKISQADAEADLLGESARALDAHEGLDRLVVTKPGEWRLLSAMEGWADQLGRPVELREDDRFLCSTEQFEAWAAGRKSLRMEYFYREMRRRTGLLMEDDEPVGGRWNFDKENRKRLPKSVSPPQRWLPEPDAETRKAMADVEERFADHFGDLEPFYFATDRCGAERARERFMQEVLPGFGDYQDAMAKGEPWMWHALLSMYINCGLLDPLETCRLAEAEWRAERAPLNAVEGFIRQIIGWREYVRGLYWLKMPEYKESNALAAERSLPEFYWTGDTSMVCMAEAIGQTKRNAYAHHIQRLMVTGNFALLAGLHPDEVNDWYMCVYADAYEWVELPNTHGMALYADGGVLASKPYAASGAYINRMSDYCTTCSYDVNKTVGEDACPFNALYWDFLRRNQARLHGNPRMGLVLNNLDRKSDDELAQIEDRAEAFLDSVGAKPAQGLASEN